MVALLMVLLANTALADDVESKIDSYLKARAGSGNLQVELLVARKGHAVIRKNYGRSRSDTVSTGADKPLRFPVGTIAEQFVAGAALRLEEQGKINLDASICDYLPSCPSAFGEIHVIHLLTHTSGLPSIESSPLNLTRSAPDNLQSTLTALAEHPLEAKPGSVFKYSELDFVLLDRLIKNVSGMPSQKYIETEIFLPLRMVNTQYAPPEDPLVKPDNLHFRDVKSGLEEPKSPPQENAASSTVGDLYRWNWALINGGVLSRRSLTRMFTPYRDGHGLGWKIIKEFDREAVLQGGRSDDISVSVRLYPDDSTCIILVARGTSVDSTDLTHDVGALLFGRHYPPLAVTK
jgi:CubicO group peptidase (beta-lactamase class C family)